MECGSKGCAICVLLASLVGFLLVYGLDEQRGLLVGASSLIPGLFGGLASTDTSGPSSVYHRERLKLVADSSRVKVTGMSTVWGEDLLADSNAVPWPEYPRPLMERPESSWLCLNGLWDYAVSTVDDPDGVDGLPLDKEWDGRIRVPFAVESLLSGVTKPLPLSESLEISPEAQVRFPTCICVQMSTNAQAQSLMRVPSPLLSSSLRHSPQCLGSCERRLKQHLMRPSDALSSPFQRRRATCLLHTKSLCGTGGGSTFPWVTKHAPRRCRSATTSTLRPLTTRQRCVLAASAW